MKLYLARKRRMEEKLGLKGKISIALGAVGAGLGTIAGVGVGSSVGAVVGGTGGFFVGQMVEGPERKRQNKINKNIEVTLIDKDKK